MALAALQHAGHMLHHSAVTSAHHSLILPQLAVLPRGLHGQEKFRTE